ncbi:response regulator [Nitrincola schmidtii]|uniref:response regulator n=1 Tax=Nitrincola schmidtii TaxID=1730894 RepID=UPI001456BA4A|nr:response regulator [Nitrincola schmidtii]
MKQSSKGNNEIYRWQVLCVDDEPSILRSLRRLLPKQYYEVFIAESGQAGLEILKQQTIDLVISDMRMPLMSGAEFLEQVATLYPDTVRILLTGYADIDSTIKAVNRGRIHRYVQKPWDTDDLLSSLEQEMESKRLKLENIKLMSLVEAQNEELKELNSALEEKVQQRTEQIRKTLIDLQRSHQQVKEQVRAIIRVFYNLLSLKGTQGSQYSHEVSQLCLLIAKRFELSDFECMNIKLSGLLSEVGVLCLNDQISHKPQYYMNAEELVAYKKHAELAFKAMSPVVHLSSIALSVLHQFDRFDGKDNSSSLSGENIPLGARILAVARDYIYAIRGVSADLRYSAEGAAQLLMQKSDIIYDPDIINHLIQVIPDLHIEHLERNEKVVSTPKLESGMKLSRDVLTASNLLLLPEGHVMTWQTIKRIQSYVESSNEVLRIYVYSSQEDEVNATIN